MLQQSISLRGANAASKQGILTASLAFFSIAFAMLSLVAYQVLLDAALMYWALTISLALVLGPRPALGVVFVSPFALLVLGRGEFTTQMDSDQVTMMVRIGVVTTLGLAGVYISSRWLRTARELRAQASDLRDANADLTDLFENAAVGMYWVDARGIILRANRTQLELIGYASDEYVGRNVAEFHVDPARLDGMLHSLARGEALSEYEARLRRKDGSFCDAIIDSSVLWRDGEFIHSRCVTRDVTASRVVEAALRELQGRLRAVTDNAPVVLFEYDTEGQLSLSEGSALHTLDPNAGSAVETSLFDAFKAPDVLELLDRTLGGEPHSTTINRRGFTFDVHLSPVRDDNGAVASVAGVGIDVSARAQTEAELRNALAFRSRLIESANNGIAAVDMDGRFTHINGRACQMLGYAEDELLGAHFTTILPREDVTETAKRLAELITGNTAPASAEMEVVRKDGERRIFSISVGTLGENGEIAGAVVISEDVTERKRLEIQLLQSQKLESVGRLAGGLAHDLNNMMTAVIGHAELAATSLTDTEPLRAMQEIRRTAERAGALTQRLLTFSRQQVIEPRLTDVSAIVTESEELLRGCFGGEVDLVTVAASEVWPVYVDPAQFAQVLVNLAANARDAMPNGGCLTIAVDNVAVEEGDRGNDALVGGDYVRLTVTDTGTGMAPEVMQHLFEPFFTTKEFGLGSGLGLATCYGIVHQAGGAIDVSSELGAGTVVQVLLPRAPSVIAEEVVERTGGPEPGDQVVLVVDDEPAVRSYVGYVLRGCGYSVIEAENGEEAMQTILNGAAPDLVISDVVMPRMGGRELANRLRDALPHTPVMFMSGFANDLLRTEDLSGSGGGFLQKPFSPQALCNKVLAALDARGIAV